MAEQALTAHSPNMTSTIPRDGLHARQCVTDAEHAQAAAAGFDAAVAMKIVSSDIAHKSDMGGVRLGVRGDAEVAAAFDEIMARAAAIDPPPAVDGVLVAPMRTDGVELIVGVTNDPAWGPVLAVGFGGIFVEVFGEANLLRLPATLDDIERAIRGLRAAPLLLGVRGRPASDLTALARVIARIGELGMSLRDRIHALEINPLYVNGDVIECLDGLIEWTA